ncbi:chemotaxis protein CheY [Sulfuricella sp. T08]|nr:chemotaxis protein CheY [Sulfuricella sp. T08]
MVSPRNYSVLVVDDDSLMREMLKAILRSEEYHVVGEASNGEDALAQCARLKPKLVLLDIQMPKMDGLQVLEAIRQAQPEIKIIMVSAEATMDKVTEAIKKGAAGFVVKPFNAARVLDKVLECVKGKAVHGG